jgi:hypothetical protein
MRALGTTYYYRLVASNVGGPATSSPPEQFTTLAAAAPTVQITTPSDGASYKQGETVSASYSCMEGTAGPGLKSPGGCVGTVPDGQPIDTSSLGSHSFKVTASSQDGQSTTKTVSYKITARAPVDSALPKITGTPKAGQTLSCSRGTWSNTPTAYHYQWYRNGTPLPGQTGPHYRVAVGDEGTTITCTVTASNTGGSAHATSHGKKIPVPYVPRCPAATGTVTTNGMGLIRFGMTRRQAEHAYRHSSNRHKAYEQFFCLTPHGIRVGYTSPKLRKHLPASQQHLAGKVIWASTTNAHYNIAGIRPPSTLTAAKHALPNGNLFTVGKNQWYIAHHHGTTAVLKIRHGIVQEIGIGDPALTKTRQAEHNFITSFE